MQHGLGTADGSATLKVLQTLNDGRRSAPYAMISPSITVSSGSASSVRAIEAKRLGKSLQLLPRTIEPGLPP